MIKVRISKREVYYNYAQTEIYVPNTVEDLPRYLGENENLYMDTIDEELSQGHYEGGFGLDQYGMCDKEEEQEWRYDILNENNEPSFGGHL